MNTTDQAPSVPISSFKRTKIIATVGPACDSYKTIYNLIKEGVNGLRLNFSHGTYEERERQIPWIRKASQELGKPVAIIQDLQGPKIRLGEFEGNIDIKAGQKLSFAYMSDYQATGHIPTQYDLSKKMKPGERLYMFDGRVRCIVNSVKSGVVYATADNNGFIMKRKGINLPDTDFGGDILTKKDLADVEFGATQDIDYVALSFVQRASDIELLRKILKKHGSDAKVIVKIETQAAVENLEPIIQATDVAMVARGDLAVETNAESVPVVQRKIIGLGQKYAKPTIVATQMLISMVDNPEPTRAEVSDVATAVFIGADCVMLSDETANGKYPVETVKTMRKVLVYAENNMPLKPVYPFEREHNMQNAISTGVINLALNIDAKAIVTETRTGNMAREIACRRPDLPIMAITEQTRTAQQLALVYSTKAYVRHVDSKAAERLADWLGTNKLFKKGDVIIITLSARNPGVAGTTDTIKIRTIGQ